MIEHTGFSIGWDKPIGSLKVNESFVINIYGKLPNRFHRFMARLLLGWKYEKYEVVKDETD